ncbi:MAG: hypothetical protein QM730_24665 [Anaerolineales bacterium]
MTTWIMFVEYKSKLFLVLMTKNAQRYGYMVDNLRAKVSALPAHALGRLQVKGGEGLSALMPSVLDRAFKGEL